METVWVELVLAVVGLVWIAWVATAYRRLRKPLWFIGAVIVGLFFVYEIVDRVA